MNTSKNKALRVSEELVDLLLDLTIVSATLTKKFNHAIRETQAMERNADNGSNRQIIDGRLGPAYSRH